MPKSTREHLTFLMFRLYFELKNCERKKTQKQQHSNTHSQKNGTENKSGPNKGLQWWKSSCDKTTKRNFWICLFYHLSGRSVFVSLISFKCLSLLCMLWCVCVCVYFNFICVSHTVPLLVVLYCLIFIWYLVIGIYIWGCAMHSSCLSFFSWNRMSHQEITRFYGCYFNLNRLL